jgi:hypothetical protein
MPEAQPTRLKADVEVGGMSWAVTPSDQLRDGRLLEMVCKQDFGSQPGYPMTDTTTVIKTDDGEMHIIVESDRNQSRYTDRVTFEPGTLRAIIDHIERTGSRTEQPSSADGRSAFGRILDSLSDHASYLSFRR